MEKIKLTGYKRYFTVEILDECEVSNVMEALSDHLETLHVRDDESGEVKKLYLETDRMLYLPIQLIYVVIRTLKTLYPNRTDYILDYLSPLEGDEVDINIKPEFKLRDYQKAYHDMIASKDMDTVFVDLRTGSGKASWIESQVLTPEGYRKLKELKVGDLLISPTKALFDTVLGIYPQGVKDLYKVILADGSNHICTLDHLWEVEIDEAYHVLPLSEIMKLSEKKDIYFPKAMITKIHSIDENTGEMKILDSFFSGNKEEPINDVASLISGEHHPNKCMPFFTIIDAYRVLNAISIAVKREDERYQDFELKDANDNAITIEAKDYFEDRRIYKFIRLMLMHLGMTTRNEHIDDDGVFTFTYTFIDYSPGAIVLSLVTNKARIFTKDGKLGVERHMRSVRLARIEYYGRDTCMCIKTSNPSSLYIVDDWMVTHNTVIATNATATIGKRVGVVVLPRYLEKWKEDYLKYTDVPESRIFTVQGREKLEEALKDYEKYDVILFSIRTLYNNAKRWLLGDSTINPVEIFKNMKIGVLLSDESHQELYSLFNILVYNDVKKLIGMSATFVSQDAKERSVQEMLFPNDTRASNVVKFENHIEYVDATFHMWFNPRKFKAMSHLGYSQILYEKSLMANKKMLNFYFDMIFHWMSIDYFDRKKKGEKALLFFATVDMCTLYVTYLKGKDECRKLSVGRYTQTDPYSVIKESDIIVSTRKSLGTAVDIPNLISVYDTIMEKSIKGNLQSMGRLRRKEDSRTVYFSISCTAIKSHIAIARVKLATCKSVIKSVARCTYGETFKG